MLHFITRRFGEFAIGHRQPFHSGHCALAHGHNVSFDVSFSSVRLDRSGFIVDFGKMGSLRSKFETLFDHKLLIASSDPELEFFREMHRRQLAFVVEVESGSCEGLAKLAFGVVMNWIESDAALVDRGVAVNQVVCWEDAKNSATCIEPVSAAPTESLSLK